MNLLQIPFVGAYKLRKDLPLLLGRLQKKDEEVVITQRGRPAAMLLSIKKYSEMQMLNEELKDALEELKDKNYLADLLKAKEEIYKGKGEKANKVFAELNI